ncbi:PREDICTED: uncharacterized protein LOC104779928 [Camelina sativa]|uniref:Uncharacterized protein LOC104779928 n=1 Tax=Camelina sativa TaxID=90675 RepID=A0ABM0YL38_CAMSA|nr:PREDICTED: uncharacterized protein LOC104779928 [Camelina sativa]XP_010502663.1 PREDICTED: uncharacterized protein LOC104779928 [Camelina sativa]
MALPLVVMFPNSTTLVLAGSWNSSPGESRMNRDTATITGPQSVLIYKEGDKVERVMYKKACTNGVEFELKNQCGSNGQTFLGSSVIGLEQRCDSYEQLTPVAISRLGATSNTV